MCELWDQTGKELTNSLSGDITLLEMNFEEKLTTLT